MRANSPRGYSADTEILTRHGWVTFDQLTYLDEVATRSADGEFLWEHPHSITWGRYSGEMIRFHGRKADLLVTPDLRMPWMADKRHQTLHWSAREIMNRPTKPRRPDMAAFLIATSEWRAPDLAEKVFPGIRHSKMGPRPHDVSMTGDGFAAFMGMYMAEGSATRAVGGSGGDMWLISVAQTPGGKGYEEYRAALIDIFGGEPGKSSYGTVWVVYSRALYDYLSPLGKAKVKWIPPDALNLSRRQLEIFWHYYFLGDGSYSRDYQIAATASKRMAGELQEIIQKLGWSAGIREEKCKPTALVKSSGIIYKLGVYKTVRPSCNIDAVRYDGMIGSAETGIGPVYVRRGNRPIWAGLWHLARVAAGARLDIPARV